MLAPRKFAERLRRCWGLGLLAGHENLAGHLVDELAAPFIVSVALWNRLDALSHLQLRALRAMRDRKTSRADRQRAEHVFQLTVNGIAAGLQNTG